jgi:serine O-acetyltransferase
VRRLLGCRQDEQEGFSPWLKSIAVEHEADGWMRMSDWLLGNLSSEDSRKIGRVLFRSTGVSLAAVRDDYHRHGSRLLNAAFLALFLYRFGRWCEGRKHLWARTLGRKIYGAFNGPMSLLTRIWIPPGVVLGDGFHIIHTEGSLSIHPKTVIGRRCGVMHNVTIGTNMRDGAPIIGDDVFIGVNSTVLGEIRIGDRVRIASNTAVTTDVPPDSIAVGSPAKIYPRLGPFRMDEREG